MTKLLKNWFSNFPEGPDNLTLDARVDAKDFQSGFLLFVSASWGYMRPFTKDGAIPVTLYARLTTGEQLVAHSSVILMDDHAAFEAMVPGILDHVQNRSTWNITRTKD